MPTISSPFNVRTFRIQENQPSKTGPWLVQPGYDVPQTLVGTDLRLTNSDPNWRQKVARKQDASQAYTRVKYTGRPAQVFCQSSAGPTTGGAYMNSRLFEQFTDNIAGQINGTGWDDSTLRDQALARIKRKLAGMVVRKNVALPVVELRELGKTIQGINALLTGTLRALIDIKRTKGKSAYKFASQQWLNFSFGVQPLLKDITEVNEAISAYLTREDVSVKLSGSATRTWCHQYRSNNVSGTYHTSQDRILTVNHTMSYRYVGGFDLRLKSSNHYTAADTFGLEVKELPSIAWELVPFSWVVDYFSTVGAYLEDTFVLPPGSLKYLVLNRRYTVDIEMSAKLRVTVAGSQIDHQSCKPGFVNVYQFSRTKLASLPYRSLRFKTLNEIGRIGNLDQDRKSGEALDIGAFNKVLNLAAVLATGVKK